MATIANLIKEVLKRAKVDAQDLQSISQALSNTALDEIALEQEDIDKVLGGLHTLESARAILKSEIAKTVKAETLNGVDAAIKDNLRGLLSDDEISSLDSEDSTHKKLKKALEFINSKKSQADGSDNARKIESLTKALDEANANLRAKDAEFETKLSETIAKHKSELFTKSLETQISSRQDIAKEKKEQRHFLSNFKADYDDYMKKNGLKIDVDTGEVVKEDGTPYYNQRNEKVSLDDVLATVVDQYEYKKLSNTPEQGTIVVGDNGKVFIDPNSDLY